MFSKFLETGSCWCATLLVVVTVLISPVMADSFGLVADNGTDRVNVFDIPTNTVIASIPVGPGSAIGDVVITPDQKLGFATNLESLVWVVDLTTSPPSLATGINPIPISNFGEELSVTPDGRFLVVNDGIFVQPISVIDIAARAEVDTFSTGTNIVTNDTCDDGTSVLVASFGGSVRRLTLGPDGTLTDTGELLSLPPELLGALNVHCAPGSRSAVVVSINGAIGSFTVPGLSLVDTSMLSGLGNTAVFRPSGDRVYVRSHTPGAVETFAYNAATGALSALPTDSVPVTATTPFYGMDQLAISADGNALYVPEIGLPLGAVNVYDATDLAAPLLASITDPTIAFPTGITLGQARAEVEVAINIKPDSDPNSINLCSGGATPVAIFGSDPVDVTLIDPSSLRFASGTVKTVGKSGKSLCSIGDIGMPDPAFFDSLNTDPDGFDDLTCHFLTEALTDLDDMSSTATVMGAVCNDPNDADGCQAVDAGFFEFTGTDSVRIVKVCP